MQPVIDKSVFEKLKSALTSDDLQSVIAQVVDKNNDQENKVALRMGRSKVYDRMFTSLIKQFNGSNPSNFDCSLESCLKFISWMNTSKRSEVVSTTWNSYKSAVMAIMPHPAIRNAISVPALNGKGDIRKRNSGIRVKRLTDEDLTGINEYLKRSSSKYSKAVMDLLFVIRKTGIRPVEILRSTIIKNGAYSFLRVKTAKKENRRYEGEIITPKYPQRYIPLAHLDDSEIARLVDISAQYSKLPAFEVWESLYEGMRFTLLRTVKNIGIANSDKGCSFYSARQQFSADLKVTPLSKEVISMIIGHEKEETIKNHYARKAYGRPLFSASLIHEQAIRDCFNRQV